MTLDPDIPSTTKADAPTASDRSADPLVEVDGLSVAFPTNAGWTRVIEDVSFDIFRQEAIGLVGESGSGKTVTSLALLGLTRRRAAGSPRGPSASRAPT